MADEDLSVTHSGSPGALSSTISHIVDATAGNLHEKGEGDTEKVAPPFSMVGHTKGVKALTVDSQGRVVSGAMDCTVRVWSAEGSLIATLGGHTGWITAVATDVCHGGSIVASGSSDKTIRLWAPDGAHLHTLLGHTDKVRALVIRSDGTIFSGSTDRTIRQWRQEPNGGESNWACVQTLTGHTAAVKALALGAGGELYSASQDATVRVWRVADGIHTATLRGHTKDVNAVATAADGGLVTGSHDRTVRVWSAARRIARQTLTGHRGSVFAVAVGPNGMIASGSADWTIRLWSLEQGDAVGVLSTQFSRLGMFVDTLAWDDGGRLFSGGRKDGRVHVWEPKSISAALKSPSADSSNIMTEAKRVLRVDESYHTPTTKSM